MELCGRGDLGDFLDVEKKKGLKLDEEQIWKFFIQICLGIQYLHKNKFLHRDIKPKNVFLTDDLSVKIGDIGESAVLANTMAVR